MCSREIVPYSLVLRIKNFSGCYGSVVPASAASFHSHVVLYFLWLSDNEAPNSIELYQEGDKHRNIYKGAT